MFGIHWNGGREEWDEARIVHPSPCCQQPDPTPSPPADAAASFAERHSILKKSFGLHHSPFGCMDSNMNVNDCVMTERNVPGVLHCKKM